MNGSRLRVLLLTFLSCVCLSAAEPAEQDRSPTIEEIEVTGNRKTRPHVVLRHLTVRVGDVASPEALVASKRRLDDTRFFKNVDVYTRPGTRKGSLVVVVRVEERRWPYFQPVGGHSGLNGWYIAPLGLCFDNFSGRGHSLNWRSGIGHRISSEVWHYQNPDFRGGTAYLDVELFGETERYRHYIGRTKIDEKVESSGFRIRVGGRSGMLQHAFVSARSERYRPKYHPILADNIPGDLQNARVVSLALGLQVDTRDSIAFPLAGYWGILSAGAAMKAADGHSVFPRLVLDVRRSSRASGRKVFALRAKMAYTSRSAPFFERFYLGGPYSLRGYPTGDLTPVGWGTKLLLLQGELRFPLSVARFPEHRHTAVLFSDAGGIWLPGEIPGWRDLYYAAGLGYRLRLRALGILRIDFSIPTGAVDENDFRFQFSVGNAF